MLQKTILDDGPILSGLLVFQQKFHLKHGVVDYQGLTSLRLNKQFSSTCRFRSSTSSRDQLIQLLVKPTGRKCPIHFVGIWGENGCNSWKISAYNGVHNASVQNSVTDLYHKSASVRFDDSCCKSEEGSNGLSIHSQGLSEYPVNHLVDLLDKLRALYLLLLASEHWNASQLKLCHRSYSASAANLTHYMALQGLDVQQLKEDLSSVGLLNLESINSYILASINAGGQLLENLVLNKLRLKENAQHMQKRVLFGQESGNTGELTIRTMKKRASMNAAALFGPTQGNKTIHIMVTVGREAVLDEMLMTNLLKAGTDIIRINCAHDGPSIWSEIIRIAKHSSQLVDKPCRVLMDLAGPKLRTGLLITDQNVVRLSPKKGAENKTISPAQVWLCRAGSSPSPPTDISVDATLCVEQKFLNKLRMGNVLSFTDVRGKNRSLKLGKRTHITDLGFVVECSRTGYIGLDTKLYVKTKNKKPLIGCVLNMPLVKKSIILKTGDSLIISRSYYRPMDVLADTTFCSTRITCSSDHLFDSVKPGEPIAFDDGKIWGKIQEKNADEFLVLITHASSIGSKLESGKSINTPNSKVLVKGLTPKDLDDLNFVAANADMVGISFARDVCDVITVQHELGKRLARKLGIVLKIETREAFENLSLLLFQAMQSSNPLGVMVARGDLMVECGWDKMADIQEEILSVCDAAQIPVIWATRVLESLIKSGLPTRAEISDVVIGLRARCVMLNKGEHIVEAVSALDSIQRKRSVKCKKAILDPVLSSSCIDQ